MTSERASDAERTAREQLAALVSEDLRAVGFTVETGFFQGGRESCGVRVFWDGDPGPTVVYVAWHVHPELSELTIRDWAGLVRQDVEPSFETAPPALHLEGVATLAVREALGRILRAVGYEVADPAELLKRVYLEVSGGPAPDGWRRSIGVAVD